MPGAYGYAAHTRRRKGRDEKVAWPGERLLFEQWKQFRERFLTVVEPTVEDFRLFREFLQGPAGPPGPQGLPGPMGPVADQVRVLRAFTESFESVTTGDTWAPATTIEAGEYSSYNFFVINTGTNSANVRLEISPDTVHWVLYPSPAGNVVGAGGILYIDGPPFLGKYVRLGYVSTVPGTTTTLDIYWNAQG